MSEGKQDVLAQLKALRLHGMAGAWAELAEQGDGVGIQTSRWLVEHLLQAEDVDRSMRSIQCGLRFEFTVDHNITCICHMAVVNANFKPDQSRNPALKRLKLAFEALRVGHPPCR